MSKRDLQSQGVLPELTRDPHGVAAALWLIVNPSFGFSTTQVKIFSDVHWSALKELKELGEQLHGYPGNFALESPRSQFLTPSGSMESELDLPFGSLSGHEGLVSTYPPGPSQRDTQALRSPRVRKPLLETNHFRKFEFFKRISSRLNFECKTIRLAL